jgi:hypothetical protein
MAASDTEKIIVLAIGVGGSGSSAKHYRRRVLCLVSHALPSAFHRTLGKEAGLPSVALGK